MQVDFSVELGRDDEVLEFPWKDPSGGCAYFDLKRNPELLADLPEGTDYPELHEFLARVNLSTSVLETAKCDAWSSAEFSPEEEVFGSARKFGSYVDLLFSNRSLSLSLQAHEKFVGGLTGLLKKSPEIPASAEFLIRRCYYHDEGRDGVFGFYISFYAFGYGDDEQHARKQWAIALKLTENAIRQMLPKPTGLVQRSGTCNCLASRRSHSGLL
jgi:hypothetical protein